MLSSARAHLSSLHDNPQLLSLLLWQTRLIQLYQISRMHGMGRLWGHKANWLAAGCTWWSSIGKLILWWCSLNKQEQVFSFSIIMESLYTNKYVGTHVHYTSSSFVLVLLILVSHAPPLFFKGRGVRVLLMTFDLKRIFCNWYRTFTLLFI